MLTNVRLAEIEIENDRDIQNWSFPQTELHDSYNGELDEISQFFSQPYLLYYVLLISNFEFARYELRDMTREFAISLNEADYSRIAQLDAEIILGPNTTNKGFKDDILKKRHGVTTHIADQKHFDKPVYSLVSSSIFKSAIIAATLMLEFGKVFEFPARQTRDLESVFSSEILFLSLLEQKDFLASTVLLDSDHKPNIRQLNKQTLFTIVDPLFKAGFISRVGNMITIDKKDIESRQENTLLRQHLLSIFHDEERIEISYRELSKKLFELYYTDPIYTSSKENIEGSISKYLIKLLKENSIHASVILQDHNQEDLGHFGKPYTYVITNLGLEFLNRVRSLVEAPNVFLGDSSEYYIHNGERIKKFYELSPQYQILLLNLIRRIFN